MIVTNYLHIIIAYTNNNYYHIIVNFGQTQKVLRLSMFSIQLNLFIEIEQSTIFSSTESPIRAKYNSIVYYGIIQYSIVV